MSDVERDEGRERIPQTVSKLENVNVKDRKTRFVCVSASDHTDVNRLEHDTGTDTDEALWDMRYH